MDVIKNVKESTISRFIPLWEKNFLEIKKIIPRHFNVKIFFGKFQDIPAIVVGAGPSLNKNIHQLVYAKDKAIIISCDAALKILLKEGITPSFVAILDPQKVVKDFFSGIDTRHMVLLAPTVVHPFVVKAWRGRIVFYNKFAPDVPILKNIESSLPYIGSLTPGGSVSSICYDLAFKLLCNPIIFIGQDLAYTDSKEYARGSIYDIRRSDRCSDRRYNAEVEISDIFGKTVTTEKSMAVTSAWFEWVFTKWKRGSELTILNCTEGGILSSNVNVLPFSSAAYIYLKKKINSKWAIDKILK